MSPHTQPTHAPRKVFSAALLLALAGALVLVATPVTARADKVAICHATGSESNPFVAIEPAAAAVYNGHLGSDHQNGEDIIPPFTYQGQVYSQNWDTEGQAIFDNDCAVPGGSDTETTTGTEVPFFGGAPLTMGLGVVGALGGALLMLRRRL
jgi:hypothetical protein